MVWQVLRDSWSLKFAAFHSVPLIIWKIVESIQSWRKLLWMLARCSAAGGSERKKLFTEATVLQLTRKIRGKTRARSRERLAKWTERTRRRL